MAAPRRWLLLAAGASASIHDLVVDRDRRALYRIEEEERLAQEEARKHRRNAHTCTRIHTH